MDDKILKDILAELRRLNENIAAQRVPDSCSDNKTPMTTYEYLLQKYGATMTWQQAADETGIYWSTIQIKCRTGEINVPKNGRYWVLTTKALAEFLDKTNDKQPEPEPVQLTGCGHRKIV